MLLSASLFTLRSSLNIVESRSVPSRLLRLDGDEKVKVGDKVNVGDTVVILEAMKMQNNIEAESAGTIASINVNKGDAVLEGDTLVTIK